MSNTLTKQTDDERYDLAMRCLADALSVKLDSCTLLTEQAATRLFADGREISKLRKQVAGLESELSGALTWIAKRTLKESADG